MNNDCIFCDRSKIEKSLICENDFCYVVATLGQITNGGYLLFIPKEHLSCVGAFNSDQLVGMFDTISKVRPLFALEYGKNLIMFEHGIVGQSIKHAHVHLLPAGVDITFKVRSDFPTSEIDTLEYIAQLPKLYAKNPEPYLFWSTPNGKLKICWNPPAPPQYLRLITAELLGRPERGNWRDMDPVLDKKLVEETVRNLKKYFEKK